MFRSFLTAVVLLGLLLFAFWLFRVHEFTNIQEAMETPEKVEFLNLSKQKMTTLPEELTQLPNLEILWLDSLSGLNWAQACTKLPRISNLRALVLSHHQLKNLPPCLGALPQLEILDISGNPDLDWENTFIQLSEAPNLNVLSLTNCKLTSLHPNIRKIKGLKKIFLMQNAFSAESQEAIHRLLPEVHLEFETP